MLFLPFENITYRTRLAPREVTRRLSKHLDSPEFDMSDLFKDRKPYIGEIQGQTFKMSPYVPKSTTFVIITGELNTDNEETIIDVKMRLPLFVKIFMAIWFIYFTPMLIAALINPAIQETSGFPIPRILGFLIFGYLLMMIGFKSPGIKAKKHLAELFEAEIENTSSTRNPQNKQYKK